MICSSATASSKAGLARPSARSTVVVRASAVDKPVAFVASVALAAGLALVSDESLDFLTGWGLLGGH